MKKKEFFKYLDKNLIERLRMKISLKKGNVIDVVVQYETLYKEKWTPIVLYDCAHGFFHRDIIFPNGEQENKLLLSNNLKTRFLTLNKI